MKTATDGQSLESIGPAAIRYVDSLPASHFYTLDKSRLQPPYLLEWSP